MRPPRPETRGRLATRGWRLPAPDRLGMGTVLIACAVAAGPATAWTVDEHRLLADSVLSVAIAPLDSVTRVRLRRALRAPWNKDRSGDETPTFGMVCSAAAADDHSPGRYHLGERTVREQLEALSAARIDTLTNRARRGDRDLLQGDRHRLRGRVRGLDVGNVVGNYLVHHVVALRIAVDAGGGRSNTMASTSRASAGVGDPDSLLRCALLYEAIAQGYLADAFSAGHLMTPPGRRLRFLHPTNRQRLHDHYGIQGLYVLDARGETWHTLGDRLLLWYGPSFDHVFDACLASLEEVLAAHDQGGIEPAADALAPRSDRVMRGPSEAVWIASSSVASPEFAQGISGSEWLARMRLAALLRIPTVAVATWSVRTDSLDAHGLRTRHHYPQLRETGGHDPSLEPSEVRRLPLIAALPDWMIAPELLKSDPLALVRDHPDYASVRFVQPRCPPPSYKGIVVSVGQARFQGESGGGGHLRYGIGYSPAGESALLLQRLSIDALLLEPTTNGGPRPVAFTVGFNFKLPGLGVWREPWLRWLEHARFSAGHAWGRVAPPLHDGARYTAGIESPVLPVRITNAAVTLRLEAEWWRFKHPRRGLALAVVMQ